MKNEILFYSKVILTIIGFVAIAVFVYIVAVTIIVWTMINIIPNILYIVTN